MIDEIRESSEAQRQREDKEKAYKAFDLKFKSFTDSLCFTFRTNPRIISSLASLRRNIMAVIADYVYDDKIPEVVEQTKEQIEESVYGVKIEKKIKRERKAAHEEGTEEEKGSEENSSSDSE